MKKLTDYIESLTITQGRRAGESFKLLPWQRRFLAGAFAPNVQSAALSVARGNGKTSLLSAVACATLDGPLVVPRGETVIVASSFSQARIAFDHVRCFLGSKLADRKVWRISDSQQVASLENRTTGARLKVIGSDPKRAHGLAPVLVLADEPAQWPESTGARMIAALRTSAGKQPSSRLVVLGTRPADPAHWFAKMLAGGADYAQCHAAGTDDPKFQRRTWLKANPSLRHMPDLEQAIRTESKHAKADASTLPEFEALRLNLGTSDTEHASLLQAGTWAAIEGAADRAGPCVWGLDLGTSAAQSAIAAYWPESGRLECVAAFPFHPSLTERGLRDGVSSLYVQCKQRGELIHSGQRAVDLGQLLTEALKRFGPPAMIACDRWREAELRDSLDAVGVPVAPLEMRGQGFKDGGEDVRVFRRACLSARVVPVESLLMRSAMLEARVLVDPAGNSKLAKQSEGGRRRRARDDAVAASILAVATGARQAGKPAPRRLHHALAG